MDSDHLVSDDEWEQWASYFGRTFPTAGDIWTGKMCRRMLNTLDPSEPVRFMTRAEYLSNLEHLRTAINLWTPDPNNKLMEAQ